MANIDWPSGLIIGEYQIRPVRTVPLQRGAYSMAESSIDFAGDLWKAEYTLRHMTLEAAGRLRAWCLDIVEPGNRGRIYTPLGTRGVLGTCDADNLSASAAVAGAGTISASGASNGQTLLSGSYLSISSHLYMVRSDVTFSGTTEIPIWPRLREAHGGGQTVRLTNARSVWKLAGNEIPDFGRLSKNLEEPLTLKLEEALR